MNENIQLVYSLSYRAIIMSGPSTRSRHSNNHTAQKRDRGRFTKQCGCLQHETFVAALPGPFHFQSVAYSKERRSCQELIARNLLNNSRTRWICSTCLKYAKWHFVTSASRISSRPTQELRTGNTDNSGDSDSTSCASVCEQESDDEHNVSESNS